MGLLAKTLKAIISFRRGRLNGPEETKIYEVFKTCKS